MIYRDSQGLTGIFAMLIGCPDDISGVHAMMIATLGNDKVCDTDVQNPI